MSILLLRRTAEFFQVESGYSIINANTAFLYDPLDTKAPESAQPTCFLSYVQFVDSEGNEIDKAEPHDLNSCCPIYLYFSEEWWTVISGEVVWFNGRWNMRWRCQKNTEGAIILNALRKLRGTNKPWSNLE